jgi:hypothetical protein
LQISFFRKTCSPSSCGVHLHSPPALHLYIADFQYKPASLSELLQSTKESLLRQRKKKEPTTTSTNAKEPSSCHAKSQNPKSDDENAQGKKSAAMQGDGQEGGKEDATDGAKKKRSPDIPTFIFLDTNAVMDMLEEERY